MVKVIYAFFFNSITKGIEILPPREVGNLDCALYIFKNQMTASLYNCVCGFVVKKCGLMFNCFQVGQLKSRL